jgi:peroxiredoxin
MRTLVAAFLTFGLVLQAAAPVPRPAPDLKITDATGKRTWTLAEERAKGHVVVIQFLYTWCQHCQNTAQMLSKLQNELGPKGLQVFGVAFNDEVNTPDQAKNALDQATFESRYAQFPVGRASRDTVLKYLGISVMERYAVPQIVVIDTKGQIVAQSKPMPTPELQNESYMRNLILSLLPGGSSQSKAASGGIKLDTAKAKAKK